MAEGEGEAEEESKRNATTASNRSQLHREDRRLSLRDRCWPTRNTSWRWLRQAAATIKPIVALT